ncbi:composite domain of metallo-dependent hydrolase [Aspergillus heteromorphus CBS 117.55]|uniref:Composite domain of metallo-dependent hydrolase n=1 Tax=Aspergillus heteromorphus CBS 117.55 TaxID=1448321 RepID=A0A317VD24_9EURO|nr:composite domain of metallo-dependent hydrolase [Aspergillus heteromorphus CBS 117.55]PWY70908.1 composite domain of metallo-dependent hydrolase [Aspergillus heteromorphus CBS 117.55]
MPSTPLQNATILVPSGDGDDVVPLRHHALLIVGNTIAQIAPQITPPSPETEILDCTGKIISPGFGQTQLKGRPADHTLLKYMPTGNLQQVHHTPEDIFWGQLAGCLKALDAGTTTVVDHAHMNVTPEHAQNGLTATVSSGIRAIFYYTLAYGIGTGIGIGIGIGTGKRRRSLDLSVRDVFRLATMQGARAIGMEESVGSVEVGKRADLVVFDAWSPGMVCAGGRDPVAAVVLHSLVRDVVGVFVDGG